MISALYILLGLITGSFLNVAILRLKSGQSVVFGRSKCPACGAVLGPADLVPVLSYLWLKGRCRHCRSRIDIQYPLVEAATAALFLGAYWLGGSPWVIGANLAAISALLVIFVYDLKWQEIPDQVSLPAIAALLVLHFIANPLSLSYLLAAIIGAAFFAVLYYFSDGAWVGGGDIRLGALAGAMLGWPSLALAIVIASIIGSLIGIALISAKLATRKTPLPFAVFLAPAALFVLFFGQALVEAYLG